MQKNQENLENKEYLKALKKDVFKRLFYLYIQGKNIAKRVQLSNSNISQAIALNIHFFALSFDQESSHHIESIIQFITINKTQAKSAIAVKAFKTFEIIHVNGFNHGSIEQVTPDDEPASQVHQAQGIFSVTLTVNFCIQSVVVQPAAKVLLKVKNKRKTRINLEIFFIKIF